VVSKLIKFIKAENRMMVIRVWGLGEKSGELFSMVYKASIMHDEKKLWQ
jgi:hypothetical protein